jgi:hypothetical protein
MGEDVILECVQIEYDHQVLILLAHSVTPGLRTRQGQLCTGGSMCRDISAAHLKIIDRRLQNRRTIVQHGNAVKVRAFGDG